MFIFNGYFCPLDSRWCSFVSSMSEVYRLSLRSWGQGGGARMWGCLLVGHVMFHCEVGLAGGQLKQEAKMSNYLQ